MTESALLPHELGAGAPMASWLLTVDADWMYAIEYVDIRWEQLPGSAYAIMQSHRNGVSVREVLVAAVSAFALGAGDFEVWSTIVRAFGPVDWPESFDEVIYKQALVRKRANPGWHPTTNKGFNETVILR